MTGICIVISNAFTKSLDYINIKGEHPEHGSIIYWNKLVFFKDQLNDDNWLYTGDATKEEKESQIYSMESYQGFVPIV